MVERCGHRGAPRVFPANTLRGFAEARRLGCTWVECDVRLSRDGALVLAHDPQVRDRDGHEWRLEDHRRDELSVLDLGAGEGVPTLEELVAWAVDDGGVGLLVDMKCSGGGVEARVAAAVAALPGDRKCVSGADRESRRAFRGADPDLPLLRTVSRGEAAPDADDAFDRMFAGWNDLDADGGSWEHGLVTPERVAALHALGGRVFAWTVDDPETMRRMAACGVDGITSNRPDLLAALAAESGV